MLACRLQFSFKSAAETSERKAQVASRTVSGSEFQIEGPEEAKPRDPYRASRLSDGIVRS